MSEFFLSRNGKVAGPFSMGQIKEFSQIGKLADTDLIRKNQGPWQPVNQVKGLNTGSIPALVPRSNPQMQAVPQSNPTLAPVPTSTPSTKPSRLTPIIAIAGIFALLLVSGIVAAYIYTKNGGNLLAIGFGSANPYSNFSSTYASNRKTEWDKLVANKKIIGDLSGKSLDELEKVFKKKANIKSISESGSDMFKSIKSQGLAKLGKVVVGDDSIGLYNKLVIKANEYFASRETPKVSTDSTSKDEMESFQAEKIKFNVLPSGYLDFFSFSDKPFEDIPIFITIATEEERKGQCEYLVCVPVGLEGKGTVPPKISDFAIEALDKDSKVIKQGRIYSKISLVVGKVVEVKGYLAFSSVEDIDRISKFILVKKPDEAFLAFIGKLQKALEGGAVNDIRLLVKTMKTGWDKKFLELADNALKDAKTTTRLGIVAGLDELFKRNIDAEAFGMLEKLIADEDATVARAAIELGDDLQPCPQQIIQKIMWAASQRKDDARKAALDFILKLDHKVPDNIALFLKELDNQDLGIKAIAANFLAKAPLEAKQNMDLGAKLIKADQEEVAAAGLTMILKQSESDRIKVMEITISMLASKFDTCRALAEKAFDGFTPFTPQDLPKLVEGLVIEAAEPKLRILRVISEMKTDAKGVALNIVKLFKDPSEAVKIRAITCVGTIQPDFEKVSAYLFEAAKDKLPAVKAEAIRTIPLVGRDQKTVELLFDSLGDPDPLVPKAAMEGFSLLKPPVNKDDLPVIGPRLSSTSNPIRKQAFTALVNTGESGVVYAKEVAMALGDIDQEIVFFGLNCSMKYPEMIENGQKKVESLLADRFLSSPDEKYATACLDYLVFFGPKASTAIPTLRRLFQNGQHTMKTPSALKLTKAIGKDCHVLIPELTRMITKPQINGIVTNQQDAKVLADFILKGNNNMALREAMAATGEQGATALSRNLLDPDPVVKSFTLLALEAMGRDAKPAMAMIYRSTVPANEKNRAVLFIAQVVYGRLQSATGVKN